jgi:hypothetical protein
MDFFGINYRAINYDDSVYYEIIDKRPLEEKPEVRSDETQLWMDPEQEYRVYFDVYDKKYDSENDEDYESQRSTKNKTNHR